MPKASVISPYQKFWNGTVPVAGGLVTLYISGTDDLAPVFVDPELKLPQTNPYRLDAAGRIRGDLRFAATCDLIVMDSSGGTVDTIPNVSCFDAGAPFSEWNEFFVYGAGGNNIVTASDGGYYVSLVDDNLGNDPISSPVEWGRARFLNLTTAQVDRLVQIGGETPSDGGILLADGSDWNTELYAGLLRNYLSGLTLSNNTTDATNDIDIAAGWCVDSTNAALLPLSTGLTKRLDATWEAGTGNGGLAGGLTIANEWYHVFVVMADGTVDVMFDTSVTCANGVANNDVTSFRRIGSILRTGGSIKAFWQHGNLFYWNTIVQDVIVSGPDSAPKTPTMSVPPGVKVTAILYGGIIVSGNAGVQYFLVTDPDQTATTPSATANTLQVAVQATATQFFGGMIEVQTNTNSQIRWQRNNVSAITEVLIDTYGWIDTRGQ